MSMIDFVSVNEDRIQLFDKNDLMVKESNNPYELAAAILSCGGPAPEIYRSSSWDDSPYVDVIDQIWEQVCDLI